MKPLPDTDSSLPKTASLNLRQIIALYIGSVLGSGILLLPGLTAELAGPASLLAWLIMSLLAIPMALTMGLLSIKLPHAGGVSHFVSRAFNPAIGSLVGYYFLLSAIMAVPVIALTGAGYTCSAFGLGDSARIPVTACILAIGLLSNYLGMKLTGQIQLAVVVATIGILVGAVLGSLHSIDPANMTPFLPHGWISVGHSATLIFWCFLGWEAISHVTEEFEDPRRDVLKGTIIASVLISILYLATVGAVIGTHSYGPGISEVSLIHLIGIAAGQNGMFITGFVTLFITIAPSIAYIGAASRLAYTLAQNGSAPQRLSLLSRRYSTPVGGLLFLMVCFAVILLVYSTGIVSLATLIQIPNATFILTYLGGSAAGLVLLKESGLGRIVSGISFLLTGAILFFVGWAIVWPVLVTIAWWIYRTITIKDLKAFYQNRI
nr:amino acid permease [uncultured Methanospirillum sp.]